jgi:hypothetical protein
MTTFIMSEEIGDTINVVTMGIIMSIIEVLKRVVIVKVRTARITIKRAEFCQCFTSTLWYNRLIVRTYKAADFDSIY